MRPLWEVTIAAAPDAAHRTIPLRHSDSPGFDVRTLCGFGVGLLLVVLGCSPSGGGERVGVFNKLVLFSAVDGVVLEHGQAVAGAIVAQKIVWSDDAAENTATQVITDAHGRFHFEPITRAAGMARLIPHSPMILQSIRVNHGGQEYIAWKHGKQTYEENSELHGRPLRLVCELTAPAQQEDDHYGVCRVVATL
jgi:hypothetical protein